MTILTWKWLSNLLRGWTQFGMPHSPHYYQPWCPLSLVHLNPITKWLQGWWALSWSWPSYGKFGDCGQATAPLVTNFWQKFYVVLCQRIIVTYSKYCWRDLIWIATQQDFIHSIKDLEWASCLHNSETDSVSVSLIRYRSLIGSIGLFNTKEQKPSS